VTDSWLANAAATGGAGLESSLSLDLMPHATSAPLVATPEDEQLLPPPPSMLDAREGAAPADLADLGDLRSASEEANALPCPASPPAGSAISNVSVTSSLAASLALQPSAARQTDAAPPASETAAEDAPAGEAPPAEDARAADAPAVEAVEEEAPAAQEAPAVEEAPAAAEAHAEDAPEAADGPAEEVPREEHHGVKRSREVDIFQPEALLPGALPFKKARPELPCAAALITGPSLS